MNPSAFTPPPMSPTAPPAMAGLGASMPPAAAPVDPSTFGDYSEWAKGEMDKGFTADQLKQTLSSSGIDLSGTEKKNGNWFTNALPTIGGIAVPALGALLAPVTGGASLLAAAGLSAAGTAGGKFLENTIEGNDLGDDVLKSGAEGAIGGAAGGLAGKLIGKGASFLGNKAGQMVEQKAATQAAEDAIEKAANTYKDVSPQLQKVWNAKDSLKHASDLGYDIADPRNLTTLSNTSNDVLNESLNRALANSGPVNLANYPALIKEALAREGGTLGSFEKIALSRGRLGTASTPAAKLLQQLEDLGAGVAKDGADPNELRQLTTKLGQLAQDAKPTVTAATGAIDPEQRAVYNVINEVRDSVKKGLYDRPEVNDSLKGLVGNITPEDVGGNAKLAEHLNNIITGAGHGDKSAAQDLLREISRNINIGNLGKAGEDVGQIVTSTGGKARAAAEAGLGEPGMDTHPLLDMAGIAAGGAGAGPAGMLSTAVQGAARVAQNPAILETLSRMGNLAAKVAPAAGVGVATASGLGADPVAVAGGAGMPGDTMGGTMQQQQGANDTQLLIDAMRAQSILAPFMAGQSGATSFMEQVTPTLQKNRLLESTLGGLPGSFANAGGAQGEAGILSRISGLIPGTEANTYQKQQQAAAQQLASAMGITPEAAASLLPQLMQNGDTAAISQGILGNMRGQLAY